MHPITHGHYPETIQKLVGMRLLNITEEQTKLKLVQGSTNIIRINHYIAYYVKQHEKLTRMTYAADWQAQLLCMPG
jgi:beta-glucosidase